MQGEMTVKLSDESLGELYVQMFTITQQAIDDATKSIEKKYYTHGEVKKILRCGDAQLHKYYAMGLRSFKQGKATLIDIDDLTRFVDKKLKK